MPGPGGIGGESKRGRRGRHKQRGQRGRDRQRAVGTEKRPSGRFAGGGTVRESMNYSLLLVPPAPLRMWIDRRKKTIAASTWEKRNAVGFDRFGNWGLLIESSRVLSLRGDYFASKREYLPPSGRTWFRITRICQVRFEITKKPLEECDSFLNGLLVRTLVFEHKPSWGKIIKLKKSWHRRISRSNKNFKVACNFKMLNRSINLYKFRIFAWLAISLILTHIGS